MKQDKMHLINKIFNNEEIRTVWDKDEEKYYISVVDIIAVLTKSTRPRKYWTDLKSKLKKPEDIAVLRLLFLLSQIIPLGIDWSI